MPVIRVPRRSRAGRKILLRTPRNDGRISRVESRDRPISQIELTISFLLVWLFIAPRWIALPFFLVTLIGCRKPHKKYAPVALLALVLSLASPIDIGIFRLYALFGDEGQGVRLCHTDVGMPCISELQAKYGEFVSLGCVSPGVYPPVWMLVWWDHREVPIYWSDEDLDKPPAPATQP